MDGLDILIHEDRSQLMHRQRQIQRLSQRLAERTEREARQQVHLNSQNMRRIMKKLIVFYTIFALIEVTYILLTYFFWDDGEDDDAYSDMWQLSFAKSIPVGIFTLFGLFNIWIQCFNKQISRQIIHPWVTCRCHLYLFLMFFPLIMAAVEFAGILLFIKYWNAISLVIQILAFISLLPANWFLFTLARWCIFVRRYVRIRDRRMNQLLFLLE